MRTPARYRRHKIPMKGNSQLSDNTPCESKTLSRPSPCIACHTLQRRSPSSSLPLPHAHAHAMAIMYEILPNGTCVSMDGPHTSLCRNEFGISCFAYNVAFAAHCILHVMGQAHIMVLPVEIWWSRNIDIVTQDIDCSQTCLLPLAQFASLNVQGAE